MKYLLKMSRVHFIKKRNETLQFILPHCVHGLDDSPGVTAVARGSHHKITNVATQV